MVFLGECASFKIFLQRDEAIVIVADVLLENSLDLLTGVLTFKGLVGILQSLRAVTILAVIVWVEFAVAS